MQVEEPPQSAPPQARQHAPWLLPVARWLQTVFPIVRYALLPYLGTRVLVIAVDLLANFYMLAAITPHVGKPPLGLNTHFPGLIWQNWQHFDGGFYLQIAVGGYPTAPPNQPYSIWEFYPLYPMLIHPLGQALGGTWTTYSLSGLLVANLAALLAIGYLFVLARREWGLQVASGTVMLQALFPASYFLSAIYTESIFLATAVACLYYARGHRWLLAGVCGGLATLARGPGILLLLPVLWEFWQTISEHYAPPETDTGVRLARTRRLWASRLRGPLRAARERGPWLSLAAILLIPLAQLAFMIYAQLHCGAFFANLAAARLWNHSFSWPWVTVIHDLIQHPPPTTTPWTYNLLPLSVALVLLFAVCTIWAFVRLPTLYALYALGMFLAPLSSGYVTSLPRYYLVIFPAFVLLARWADPERHLQRYTFLILSFGMLLAILTTFYELGFQISGA